MVVFFVEKLISNFINLPFNVPLIQTESMQSAIVK